jgi:hypothetical protein
MPPFLGHFDRQGGNAPLFRRCETRASFAAKVRGKHMSCQLDLPQVCSE